MGIHLKITAEAARSLLGTEDTEIPEKSPCSRVAVVPYFSTPSIAINPSVMLYVACATIEVVVL
jgi:hypothetical protein